MFFRFSLIRNKMIDVNTRKQVKHSPNIRLSEIKLSDTYPMLSHSNVNCFYFIISVK